MVRKNKESLKLGIFYRPFLKECLRKLRKHNCEIFVWSSGLAEYANKIINSIDPENELFDMRLFREQCYITPKGLFMKDLRMIHRDLDRIIIVDNCAYSFGFQLSNGVLICPYKGEQGDTEMLTLTEYLLFLIKQQDFRKINNRHFKYDVYEKETKFDAVLKKLSK